MVCVTANERWFRCDDSWHYAASSMDSMLLCLLDWLLDFSGAHHGSVAGAAVLPTLCAGEHEHGLVCLEDHPLDLGSRSADEYGQCGGASMTTPQHLKFTRAGVAVPALLHASPTVASTNGPEILHITHFWPLENTGQIHSHGPSNVCHGPKMNELVYQRGDMYCSQCEVRVIQAAEAVTSCRLGLAFPKCASRDGASNARAVGLSGVDSDASHNRSGPGTRIREHDISRQYPVHLQRGYLIACK